MKKALCVGDYNPELIYQASSYCGDQIFAKGLEKNGYSVFRLNYRALTDPNQKLLEMAWEI